MSPSVRTELPVMKIHTVMLIDMMYLHDTGGKTLLRSLFIRKMCCMDQNLQNRILKKHQVTKPVFWLWQCVSIRLIGWRYKVLHCQDVQLIFSLVCYLFACVSNHDCCCTFLLIWKHRESAQHNSTVCVPLVVLMAEWLAYISQGK